MSTLAGDLGGLGRVDPAINIVFECGVAAGDGPRPAWQGPHGIVVQADVLAIRGAARFGLHLDARVPFGAGLVLPPTGQRDFLGQKYDCSMFIRIALRRVGFVGLSRAEQRRCGANLAYGGTASSVTAPCRALRAACFILRVGFVGLDRGMKLYLFVPFGSYLRTMRKFAFSEDNSPRGMRAGRAFSQRKIG